MVTILDLPNELLSNIFSEFEDIRDYLEIALVCKKFQKVIQSIVVTTGDGPTQSELSKSISNTYVQIDIDDEAPHLKSSLKSFKHFIFEYSLYKKVHLQTYIKFLSKAKPKRKFRITEVIINDYASRYSFGLQNLNDIKLENSYLFDVIRTIYANGSDFALLIEHWHSSSSSNTTTYESMNIVGHHYNFSSLKVIPWLLVARNPYHDLSIHGRYIEQVCGILSIDKSDDPCSETNLTKYFKNCFLPNLTVLDGLSVSSGFTFRALETFENLEELRMRSYTTEFAVPRYLQSVSLNNLRLLEIAGDSISLTNLSFPQLIDLSIILQGSTRSGHQSDIIVKNFEVPNMENFQLRLMVNCKHSVLNILRGFKDFNKMVKFKILGNMKIKDLAYFNFPSMEEIEARSLPFTVEGKEEPNEYYDPTAVIQNNSPNLRSMKILGVFDFFDLLLGETTLVFKGLKELMVSVDYKRPDNKRYMISKEHYPDLETLTLLTRNFKIPREGDFESLINITLDLPKLKVISGLKAFLDRCITWKSDNSDVKVVKL